MIAFLVVMWAAVVVAGEFILGGLVIAFALMVVAAIEQLPCRRDKDWRWYA